MVNDPNSLSNTSDVQTTHIHLDLSVNFAKKILSGYVILDLLTLRKDVSEIILDTRDIDVRQVLLDEKPLKFHFAPSDEKFGSALHIELPENFAENKSFKLKLDYNTSPTCTAAQWLEPSQTCGKKYPYFFTQCQAIHARSLLPCQDTPAIKLTYSAHIRSPYQTLMSAIIVGEEDTGDGTKIYKFEQLTKIPSYLIALAIGNIKGKKIGPRSTVWTEPENLEASAWEFADTEKFIATGEDLLTPYEWGKYDLLVLPPSFPYGGMENPSLTFVTPTLLAGDRSLVDVVAHEISHSWMGNLVTSTNWEHFWLNEGWTVFVERKILGRLHGEKERQFQSIIGYRHLMDSIEKFGADNPLTALAPKLDGVDPDDSFSSVPYEKGFNFLYYIEKIVGGPQVFEPYMKAYVKQFMGRSITTDDWKDYLFKYMEENHGPEKKEALLKIDWDRWINAPGLPPVKNEFDQTFSKACSQLAKRWDDARNNDTFEGFSPNDIKDFNSNQKMVFLQRLFECPPFPYKAIEALDKVYNLTNVMNSEVRFWWQEVCLRTGYEPIFPHVVKFVTEQGRMKYVRPLYRSLNRCNSELAKKTFLENKSFYHPIAATMIERDIM
ncbi:7152_t:CDS:10 [Ambispora leptoticha]|uniref:Leukotriene A(4) hydrolase n=1 Tax=Ambispora leptoticha TaxID=144679 RepID=A0A9N9A8X8_9GLOM|nr:7152_t:CDS:10 [Ambispora leptoticha]